MEEVTTRFSVIKVENEYYKKETYVQLMILFYKRYLCPIKCLEKILWSLRWQVNLRLYSGVSICVPISKMNPSHHLALSRMFSRVTYLSDLLAQCSIIKFTHKWVIEPRVLKPFKNISWHQGYFGLDCSRFQLELVHLRKCSL